MKTKFYSDRLNSLSKGCKMCVKGRKLVLFITGVCQRKCFYCSISDDKNQNPQIYANELKISNFTDIIKEAEISSSKGAGITGGDPLACFDKTIQIIKLLKKHFGKKFHIHLYTIPESISSLKLKKLVEAGLDEIRLHPNLEDEKFWCKLMLLDQIKIDKGIEIPVIPHLYKKTLKLLDFGINYVDFVNLNELEFADNDINSIKKFGYKTKNQFSYAIKDSYKYGLKILNHFKKSKKSFHLCSSKLKDQVQLKNRIKLRAKKVRLPWEKITKEGTLLRYAIYTNSSLPTKKGTKKDIVLLNKLKLTIKHKIDSKNHRILIKKPVSVPQGFKIVKIEEYPTEDNFIVQLDLLKPQ